MNNRINNTETFYKEIITKVIDQSKDAFANEGVNEEVILQLKKVHFHNLNYI